MSYFTYDTSVFISRKLGSLSAERDFLLSSIVLMELIASAKDESVRKEYERLFRVRDAENTLIVPDAADWILASKILYWLSQSRRRSFRGKLKQLAPGVSQRIALDVLIAVSARRWKATVITDNWQDFKAIQRYCGVKIRKASDYFSNS